jgi:hypothetical protein
MDKKAQEGETDMRSIRLTAGLVALTALMAGGCAAGAQGPVGDPTVASVGSSTMQAVTIVPVPPHVELGTVEDVSSPAQVPTGTATTTSLATVVTDVTTDELDQLLAGLDGQLAGLDRLLNDAAAALAAEEGEIVP